MQQELYLATIVVIIRNHQTTGRIISSEQGRCLLALTVANAHRVWVEVIVDELKCQNQELVSQ